MRRSAVQTPADRRVRGSAAALVFSALFLLLLARLAQMQVLDHRRYAALAEQNRLRAVPLRAARGRIYDRNGTLLVDSRAAFDIEVYPQQIKAGDSTYAFLAGLLKLDPDVLAKKVQKQKRWAPTESFIVVHDADMETISKIEEHNSELPGVKVGFEPIRQYRYGEMGAHLLGYVGEVSEPELERLKDQGYRRGSFVGRTGLEEAYEAILRGEDGKVLKEVDSRGREIGDFEGIPPIAPQNGNDLYLGIDLRLQQKAEELLGPARNGAVCALDPRNGEILALVSHPGYDPNLFAAGIRQEDWARLRDDPRFPLWNRAVKSGYPAGSTFKSITAIAGLEQGVITPLSLLPPCLGAFRYGNRYFKCGGHHGSLPLEQAIIVSCDIYFYELGIKLGLDRLSKTCLLLGLGRKTGVDLPEESGGLIPTPDYYDRKLGPGKWGQGTALNMAIGQGEVLVTPLQMAVFYGAVGNDGRWERPHLVRKAIAPDGMELPARKLPGDSARKDTSRMLPVSSSNIALLKKAWWGVVNSGYGTGSVARVAGLDIGGKTGTAQNPHGDDHSWFVAIAPVDSPRIAVAVVAENAGWGASVAAPIAGQLIGYFLSPPPVPMAQKADASQIQNPKSKI